MTTAEILERFPVGTVVVFANGTEGTLTESGDIHTDRYGYLWPEHFNDNLECERDPRFNIKRIK